MKEREVCNGSLFACVNGCRSEYSDQNVAFKNFAVI